MAYRQMLGLGRSNMAHAIASSRGHIYILTVNACHILINEFIMALVPLIRVLIPPGVPSFPALIINHLQVNRLVNVLGLD